VLPRMICQRSMATMTATTAAAIHTWLQTGHEVFPAMLAALDAARRSVCLETYIYAPCALGERVRAALIAACQRGVEVRVLIDALGSYALPEEFWGPLEAAGGEVRWFNPLSLNRWGIRDHRKLLICDKEVAFVGGFNVAPEYEGDGVNCGWCDLGLRLQGDLAAELAASFDDMFRRADMQHKRMVRFRASGLKRTVRRTNEEILLSGPGRGRSPVKRSLQRDLECAQRVQIMAGYFLPTWRLRRQLARVARRGGRVELMLPAKSDVAVSLLAGQSLYRRLLRSGIQIYEYQPQVLHAKLMVIDDAVYVGSANLDPRSLHLNYELLIRFENPKMATEARTIFRERLAHCRSIDLESWRRSRSLWSRFKQHWAYFLLVRVDPYISRQQWNAWPD
jgi:cardiolipin synthase A/B